MRVVRDMKGKSRGEVIKLITDLERRFKGAFGEGVEFSKVLDTVSTLLDQRKHEMILGSFEGESTETLFLCLAELRGLTTGNELPLLEPVRSGGDKETTRGAVLPPKTTKKAPKKRQKRRKKKV